MDKGKTKCRGYGMFTGILWVVGSGAGMAAAAWIPIRGSEWWAGSPSDFAALLACGVGLGYVAMSALDWAVLRRALGEDPLPEGLDLSERAVAAERLAAVKGCGLLSRHVRRLLAAWAGGASGPQVATMAASQTMRTMATLVGEAAAMLALLAAVGGFGPPQALLTFSTGMMALGVLVAVGRLQLVARMAGYVESNLLACIGNDTPAAAGAEFAKTVGKSAAESTAALASAQEKVAAQLAKAQADAAAQLSKMQSDAAGQVAKAQQEAAAQIAKASDKIAEQLGRIGEMAASIDGVLKVQEAVDGAIRGVAATEDFKAMLAEFKRHLATSDELLKNASKPRKIRLVEKDNE
jgi:hypothetical protein